MAKEPERDYSAVPMAKKLGMVTSSAASLEVAVLSAPRELAALLGDLPPNVTLHKKLSAKTGLVMLFVRKADEVAAAIDLLAAQLPKTASAWIIRPKSHLKPGFNENDVRDAALAVGLVDYKICSVSDDWSGIKFAWRKTKS